MVLDAALRAESFLERSCPCIQHRFSTVDSRQLKCFRHDMHHFLSRWNVPHYEWCCEYWVRLALPSATQHACSPGDHDNPQWDMVVKEFSDLRKLRD